MTYLLFVGIVLSVTHLKGLNVGNKRIQARRAARQALKSKPRIHGYENEAQNVTASQMKMFLTRMDERVTVIVNGDVTQCDIAKQC